MEWVYGTASNSCMPVTTREKLRDQLRRGEIARVYTLFGEESFLRDAAVRYIADLCFSDGDLREFNEAEFSLNTPDNLPAALAAAEQLPMMAAKRVIRIADVRIGSASNRDTLKEDFEETLAAYLEKPSETSVVIFVANELNGTRKLAKLLKEKSAFVEFRRLDDGEVRRWTADKFREQNCEIRPETINLLVELVGNDLHKLGNEIRKLATASLPEGTVTNDLVNWLVPHTREFSNFALTDNLVAGRKREALLSLKKILDDGLDPLAMLGLISSNYRRLLIAHEMVARGESRNRVETTAKIFGPGLELARRVETRALSKALQRIAETDFAIKTSSGGGGPSGARLQLEMLVCELALL